MQIDAELYNGSVETGEGSGFLLGDATVVTDSHVVPRLADYRRVTIVVRLGRRDAAPINAVLQSRDPDTDVAALKLAAPQLAWQPPCPISSFGKDASTPLGTTLVVLGYPVGKSFSVTGGLLSNQDEPGRWQTDATMNVGNSGGPVFDVGGHLLGFAVAGMTWYGNGETGTFVSGVNFFVPVHAIMSSAIASQLRQPPPCWNIADADETGQPSTATAVASAAAAGSSSLSASIGISQLARVEPPSIVPRMTANLAGRLRAGEMADIQGSLPTIQSIGPASASVGGSASSSPQGGGTGAAPSPTGAAAVPSDQTALLSELSREVPVSWMKDDHDWLAKSGRDYTRTVMADPGYRIEKCEGEPTSANNASVPSCSIAPDGKSAVFRTRLTSGPAYDRWRGWWHGQIALTQSLLPH